MKTKPENKILPHSEIDDQITHVSQDQLDELIEKGKTNGSLTYETVIAFAKNMVYLKKKAKIFTINREKILNLSRKTRLKSILFNKKMRRPAISVL